MPINKVVKNNQVGYRYGTHGHIYATRAGAVRQAQAIHAAGFREPTKKIKSRKDLK
jgi:hypothetical protein